MKVHNPNYPSPRWKGKSPGGGNYLDSLMELDDNSGQVVQAIRDLGLAENTLVIWTTDNGAWIDAWPDAGYTPFRGMKGSSFEGGFRVPAIAWWPGTSNPARSTWRCCPTWTGGRPSASSPGSSRRRTSGRTTTASRSSSTASTTATRSSATGPASATTSSTSTIRASAACASRTTSCCSPPRTPGWDRTSP